MHSPLRALARLFLFLIGIAYIIPVQLVLNRISDRAYFHSAMTFLAFCGRTFGIDVVTHGRISETRPTLFVINHASYLDIIVFGGLVPGAFVAKREVRSWPFFGFLATLQRNIFIDRRPRYAAGQRDALSTRLAEHGNIFLFPEGTSTDGGRTLPFKSALFSVAEVPVDGKPLVIQPVTIAYVALDGIPLGRHLRPLFTWYGDMDLLPHVWIMAGLGRLTVAVDFHEPVTLPQFGSRKALAEHCSRVVGAGLAAELAGRRPETLARPAAGSDGAAAESPAEEPVNQAVA